MRAVFINYDISDDNLQKHLRDGSLMRCEAANPRGQHFLAEIFAVRPVKEPFVCVLVSRWNFEKMWLRPDKDESFLGGPVYLNRSPFEMFEN